MFDAATLAAYLVAAAILVFIPGPGTAWIIAQSAAGGTARGIQAAFGLETATLIHALAAGLGLSALLATSAWAFEVLKYAGAAYLIWLGLKAWRSGPAPNEPAAAPEPGTLSQDRLSQEALSQDALPQAMPAQAALPDTPLSPATSSPGTHAHATSVPASNAASARNVYLRSVLTGVLNPKVALFFLAFLPQFVHPERGMVWLQFLVLGALLSVIGMINSLILSFAVGRFGRRFAASGGRWKERLTGSVFIALGLRLAVQQRG